MDSVCTGDGWNETLAIIVSATAEWTVHNMLMARNTIAASIEAALTTWFLMMHKMAAIKYLDCDQETGKVSFQDKF